MLKSLFLVRIVIGWILYSQAEAYAVPRSKDFRGGGEVVSSREVAGPEPSCEELKAMWRFSKRQSRAAEITNEIPTYRDPFSYNVWEPYYARSRSGGGMRIGNGANSNTGPSYRAGPVYGRVVHKAPFRIRDIPERGRAFEEVARMYGNMRRATEPRRRLSFRLGGGQFSMGLAPQTGSFQHLKELIRTERARELQKQRLAEEAMARHSLKDRPNYNYNDYDTEADRDEPMVGREGVLAFPDLLAPPIRQDNTRYMPEYYTRDRHSAPYFDASSFNNDLDGIIF